MSPAQNAYIEARVRYDDLADMLNRAVEGLDWDADFDKAFDAEEQARTDLGMDKAWDALKMAERALIEWARGQVRTMPDYRKNRVMLDTMFEKAPRHPAIYDRLVETCMKLAA